MLSRLLEYNLSLTLIFVFKHLLLVLLIKRGKHNWDTLNFEVLPHALRVHFPEFDDDLKDEPRAKVDWPPSSDFSNLSDREPAVYMDVKIPSEHYMYGKQYPGELHIGHRYTNKIVYIGVMIDVKGNETNTQFDQFIKEWEEIAWQRKFNCENGDGDNKASYSRKHPILLPNEMKSIWGKEGKRSDFDLFSMLPTVYYFGYEGSYTAPPCVERVHWRILDLPIYISQEQYLRLQSLFMDSLTEDCAKNEVAFQGRVNRPLQTHKNKNDVWHCSAKYWKPKHAVKWCDKWDEDYHGYNKLRKIGVCAQK